MSEHDEVVPCRVLHKTQGLILDNSCLADNPQEIVKLAETEDKRIKQCETTNKALITALEQAKDSKAVSVLSRFLSYSYSIGDDGKLVQNLPQVATIASAEETVRELKHDFPCGNNVSCAITGFAKRKLQECYNPR